MSKDRGEEKDRSGEKTEEISGPREEKRKQVVQLKMCCTTKEAEKESIQLKRVLYNLENEKPESVRTMTDRRSNEKATSAPESHHLSSFLLLLLTFHLILNELFHVLEPHVFRSNLQDHGIVPLWRTRGLSSR